MFLFNRHGVKFCHWESSMRTSKDNTNATRTSSESTQYDYVDVRCINQPVRPPSYLEIISDEGLESMVTSNIPREGVQHENTESGFINTTVVQPPYTELNSEKRVADDTHRYDSLQN